MMKNILKEAMQAAQQRGFASAGGAGFKVAVLGAAGGIGQPLSLLLKLNPEVKELSLYDIANVAGVGADISHVNSPAKVKAYEGEGSLSDALKGCDMVVIPAGVPRKPGMTRDDLFNINAGIVKGLTEAIGKNCPGAVINMISNPVNSTVPIAAETLKKMGSYDKTKLFGVTTLDVVRAKTFYAEMKGLNISEVDVPVVGGHAGITILPLFSQAAPKPGSALTDEEVEALTKRTQDGGTEVVNAKAGKGSATLSMAYAGALFADACMRGLKGEKNVVECSFVESSVDNLPYFSSKVLLGKKGLEEVFPVGTMSSYENENYKAMLPELESSIQKGYDFVHKPQ